MTPKVKKTLRCFFFNRVSQENQTKDCEMENHRYLNIRVSDCEAGVVHIGSGTQQKNLDLIIYISSCVSTVLVWFFVVVLFFNKCNFSKISTRYNCDLQVISLNSVKHISSYSLAGHHFQIMSSCRISFFLRQNKAPFIPEVTWPSYVTSGCVNVKKVILSHFSKMPLYPYIKSHLNASWQNSTAAIALCVVKQKRREG